MAFFLYASNVSDAVRGQLLGQQLNGDTFPIVSVFFESEECEDGHSVFRVTSRYSDDETRVSLFEIMRRLDCPATGVRKLVEEKAAREAPV